MAYLELGSYYGTPEKNDLSFFGDYDDLNLGKSAKKKKAEAKAEVALYHAAALKAEAESAEKSKIIADLQDQVATLQAQIQQMSDDMALLQQQLDELTAQNITMNNDLVELQTQLAQAQAGGQSAGYPITQTYQPASQMPTDSSQPYIAQPQQMLPPYTPYRMAEPSEDEMLPEPSGYSDDEIVESLGAIDFAQLIPAVANMFGGSGAKQSASAAPVITQTPAKVISQSPMIKPILIGAGGLLIFAIVMRALK